ncbi:hydrolase, partial [Candidatus Falkowbacteria bacterium]|nr:hydrolase [Candidatus Falkowbacteria bacterium]
MKRAIIVHCWEGYPEYCWYPWVKEQLEARGFQVEVPALPETDLPQLSGWLPALQQLIGQPDEELYLIGHSLGCATIMRYLESLPEDQGIGG